MDRRRYRANLSLSLAESFVDGFENVGFEAVGEDYDFVLAGIQRIPRSEARNIHLPIVIGVIVVERHSLMSPTPGLPA